MKNLPNTLLALLVCYPNFTNGDMEAYKGITVGGYQATSMEFTIARRPSCKEATFLAAFTAQADGKLPELTIVSATDEKLSFTIKPATATYRIGVQPDESKAEVTIE